MSSAKAVPGYRMFVRDLRKPGTVESCELPPTDQRQHCSTTSVVCTRKESGVCTLTRNEQFRPWKASPQPDLPAVRPKCEVPRVPITPKSSQRKATVKIKSEKEEDPDGRITAFHFKTCSVTTRTKEPSKRRPRGGTIFERRGENDNVSLITTDTQKLLAMLEESDNEGPEGLSIGQSAKISSTRSSSESVFEPLNSSCKKSSFLRVVQKKPSPVGLSPLDRLEKRWNKPVVTSSEEPERPHPTANNPCPPTYQTELPPTNAEHQNNWWTRAEAHKWKERARLQKTGKSGGYASGQNTSQLPPIAHLGQLSGKPKNLTCDTGDCKDALSERPKRTFANGETEACPRRKISNTRHARDSRPSDSATSVHSRKSRRVASKSRSRHSIRLPRPKSDRSRMRFVHHGGDTNRSPNRMPHSYNSTVFAQEMIKTNQVYASRSSAGKSSAVHKVFGDPSVIKMNDYPPSKHPRTGPLQASDLMALEEDVNDEQQQEDSKRLARFMSEDLKDQVFTDISIHCKNREFKIHKEYLLAFTTYDIPVIPGETLRDIPALDLSDLDSSDVATVLHFLYYGELKLNAYNILGVRAAVQALGVTDLPAIIQEFHDKLFIPPNLTNLIEFAQAKKLQDLFTYSWKLFVAMFYEHVNGAHFLNWDVKWVLNLLSHENLPIKTELEVFEAGRLWLNNRPEERSDDVKAVLTAVRWTYMSPEEMVECEREDPTLMSRFEAHELVSDANWYKVMMRNGVPWSDFNIPPPRGTDSDGGPSFRPPRPPLQSASNCRFDDRAVNASPSPLSQSTRSDRNLFQRKSVSMVRSTVSTMSRQSNRVNFADDRTDAGADSESSFNSLDIDMSNLSLTSLEG